MNIRASLAALISLALFSPALQLHADTIFLNDGSLFVVEKAWVEGDVVKYQTSRGIQTLPRSAVREIQEQKPIPAASHLRWGFGELSGPASSGTRPAASGGGFSNEALTR